MNIHAATFEVGLQVWWAYKWRSILRSVLVCLVFGLVMGLVGKALSAPVGLIVGLVVFICIPLAWAIYVLTLQEMMDKGFGKLQLMLVRVADMSPVKPDFISAVQVWWALAWRTSLMTFPIHLVFIILMTIIGVTSDMPPDVLRPIVRMFAFIIWMACSLFITHRVLERGFGNMQLAVIDRMED